MYHADNCANIAQPLGQGVCNSLLSQQAALSNPNVTDSQIQAFTLFVGPPSDRYNDSSLHVISQIKRTEFLVLFCSPNSSESTTDATLASTNLSDSRKSKLPEDL